MFEAVELRLRNFPCRTRFASAKENMSMTPQGTDPYGSKETGTEYEPQTRPSSRAGFARSAWSVAAATVFLVLIAGWFLYHPAATDPAPGGSAKNGVVTTPGPANSGGAVR
jgi:hypothetical protein